MAMHRSSFQQSRTFTRIETQGTGQSSADRLETSSGKDGLGLARQLSSSVSARPRRSTTSNARRFDRETGPWSHCGCISCVAQGGPQKRSQRMLVDCRLRAAATLNWRRFGDGRCILDIPKTARNADVCSDLRPASTPGTSGLGAIFCASRACEGSLTDICSPQPLLERRKQSLLGPSFPPLSRDCRSCGLVLIRFVLCPSDPHKGPRSYNTLRQPTSTSKLSFARHHRQKALSALSP